jgi:MotA/TolQ/ExbB proton channel family
VRAYQLRQQEILFLQHLPSRHWASLPDNSWAGVYLKHYRPGADQAVLQQALGERAQGRHEIAWWINGLLLKLGLLGTVAGFILMSLQVGKVGTFDIDKIQMLLKGMTYGMGIALLTTLVGLVANIILGWQLLLLDREADKFIVAVTEAGEQT